MILSPFLKLHKKNLKKLTKSQVINQVLIGIDMHANESLRLEGFLKSAESALIYKEKLQEETEEALRRCRNLLASEQELNKRLVNKIYEIENK